MKAFSRHSGPFPTSGREGDLHGKDFHFTFSCTIVRTFGTRQMGSIVVVFIRRVMFVVNGTPIPIVFGIELVKYTIQTTIETNLKLFQKNLLGNLINTNIFAVPSCQETCSIRRIGNACKISRGCIVICCHSVVNFASSLDILLTINLTNQTAIFCIPKPQKSSDCSTANLVSIRAECHADDIRSTLKGFRSRIALVQIPNFYSAIPTRTSQRSPNRMKVQTGHRTLVSSQHIRQLARLNRPNAHAKRLGGPGTHHLPRFIHRHAQELTRNVGRIRLEIPITMQIVRTHRPIQTRRQYHGGIRELYRCDGGSMSFGEGDVTESGLGVP
mmetsp:Transcript_19000/g.35424  ORF Transcript_19000/g.35424 Transcript_19000/m.35424 type:complete len:328 (+) Transcript_19000:534-1517(+)